MGVVLICVFRGHLVMKNGKNIDFWCQIIGLLSLFGRYLGRFCVILATFGHILADWARSGCQITAPNSEGVRDKWKSPKVSSYLLSRREIIVCCGVLPLTDFGRLCQER